MGNPAPYFIGDILTNQDDGQKARRLLMRVSRVSHGRLVADAQSGRRGEEIVQVAIYNTDTLVACGIHDDCRASIDLAVACADQRRGHPISTVTKGNNDE